MARVPTALRTLSLELVDLLDDVDRDDDVVVVEPENRVRIVEEDVRVEDVVLLHIRGRASRSSVPLKAWLVYPDVGMIQRPAIRKRAPTDMPTWLVRAERLLVEAVRSVRLLGTVVPRNAAQER